MKTALVLLITTIFALNASAQLEVYAMYTKGGTVTPDINLYGEKKISSKISLTYFALVEQKWSEALVGASYSPSKFISVGVSTGIEQSSAIYRFGAFVWAGKDRTSLIVLGEHGAGTDNYWYKATASYKVSETFSTGLRAWRYVGIGPVETYIVKTLGGTSFWIMPAHDFEASTNRLLIGVDITL